MRQVSFIIFIALLGLLCCGCETVVQKTVFQPNDYKPVDKGLYDEIVAMDSVFFSAYNICDLEKQAEIFSDNIEFFHDQGGLITSKKDIIEGTKNNICGKVTRELIEGSIEVYPINEYGAVQMGYHQFHNKQEPESKPHPSKFINIWKKENEKWKLEKVISLH